MNYIQIKPKDSDVKIEDLGFSDLHDYTRAFYEGKTPKLLSETFEVYYGSRLRDMHHAIRPSTIAASQRLIDVVEKYNLKGLNYRGVNVPELDGKLYLLGFPERATTASTENGGQVVCLPHEVDFALVEELMNLYASDLVISDRARRIFKKEKIRIPIERDNDLEMRFLEERRRRGLSIGRNE